MIEKTIGEIEAKIRGANAVNEERKRELLQLLGQLKYRAAYAQNLQAWLKRLDEQEAAWQKQLAPAAQFCPLLRAGAR